MSANDLKPPISPGTKLSNQDLKSIFKVGNSGGIRRSLATNSLIVISKTYGNEYENRWEGKVLHYVGQGLEGDQDILYLQNSNLRDHFEKGISVFLFENFKKDEYIFQGDVELNAAPYQQNQLDRTGNLRKVWIFPLILKSSGQIPIPQDTIQENRKKRENKASKLSDQELSRRVKNGNRKPSARETISTVYERDPYVVELCLRRAGGYCELCSQQAPFKKKSGAPYLECHHIKWLAKGGPDIPENTVALCPNCHRKMHSRNDKKDQDYLFSIAANRKEF